MKKIIQTGLIVSSLASLALADINDTTGIIDIIDINNTVLEIEHEAVKISKDGTMELIFTSPFSPLDSSINVQSVGEHIKGNFTITLDTNVYYTTKESKYKITLKHKDGLHSCNEKIGLQDESLRLNISFLGMSIPENPSSATATINYKPCYQDNNNSTKHDFETEHPYKNNVTVTKKFPASCPPGSVGICMPQYAHIKGETEKGYDFITISQGYISDELNTFSGTIDKKIKLDSSLPTTITFTSDHSITKSGVTVDFLND